LEKDLENVAKNHGKFGDFLKKIKRNAGRAPSEEGSDDELGSATRRS
jgi:hypothetical protein